MILHGECAKLAGSEQNRWYREPEFASSNQQICMFFKAGELYQDISEIVCRFNSIHLNLKVSINDVQAELSDLSLPVASGTNKWRIGAVLNKIPFTTS